MKNTILAGLVLVVIALGIALSVKSLDDSTTTKAPPVAAATSPDLPFRYLNVGGVKTWYGYTGSLVQATTTVCSIQSPVATSTILTAQMRLDVSSTSASKITFAKAATPSATTTLLYSYNVAAGAQAAIWLPATSTSQAIVDTYVFAPNTFFNVGMSGGTGTFSPTGDCKVTWQEV